MTFKVPKRVTTSKGGSPTLPEGSLSAKIHERCGGYGRDHILRILEPPQQIQLKPLDPIKGPKPPREVRVVPAPIVPCRVGNIFFTFRRKGRGALGRKVGVGVGKGEGHCGAIAKCATVGAEAWDLEGGKGEGALNERQENEW